MTNDVLNSKISEKAYDDALHPASKEVGKFLSRPLTWLNSLFSTADTTMEQKELLKSEILKRTEMYLTAIPTDQLLNVKQNIGAPIIQQLSYTIDEKDISDMYIRLLSASAIKEKSEFVHPCFIKILEQFSNLDAKVFKLFTMNDITPVIQFYFAKEEKTENEGYIFAHVGKLIIENAIFFPDEKNYPLVQFSISNLTRLGLIEISKCKFTNDSLYENILRYFENEAELIIKNVKDSPEYSGFKIITEMGVIKLTPIGKTLKTISLL